MMQDSLEEYLKLTKNTGQDEAIKISKEMVVTAQLKKECDARAMKIVEFSIEGKLRPEVFTRCLPFINQSNYQDIVEERAITKLCGYSVCGKRIPDMPKKQYFISTKSNKVYDITERKNFCSNFCYKASLHIKKQLDNSPLWLRKLEDIPEYKLLHSSEGGLPGDLIDQGIVKAVEEPNFTSIKCFTNASLGDLLEKEINSSKNDKQKTKGFKKSSLLKGTMQTIKENEVEEDTQDLTIHLKKNKDEKKHDKKIKKEIHHKKNCVVSLPSIEENEEKLLLCSKDCENNDSKENVINNRIGEERKCQDALSGTYQKETQIIKQEIVESNTEKASIKKEDVEDKERKPPENIGIQKDTCTKLDSIETIEKKPVKAISLVSNNKKQPKKKTQQLVRQKIDIETIVTKSLEEWFTLETCIFIHGEPKVREILNEKKMGDYFEDLQVIELKMEQQAKYMEICRRLHLQEMADDKFDSALVGNQKLKPLPNFEKLKEDTKKMNLRVKSFFEGGMYEEPDTNFPTKINKSDKEGDTEENSPAVLPPVDVHSQKLLRRKIFLNSLNKAVQELLQSLGVSYYSALLSDIQALVKTFSLKADNIMFKPVVWSYIALVLLSLLSLKDESLKEVLEERRSQEYIKVLFEVISIKNFVSDVLSNVKDIEMFVKRYITRD